MDWSCLEDCLWGGDLSKTSAEMDFTVYSPAGFTSCVHSSVRVDGVVIWNISF